MRSEYRNAWISSTGELLSLEFNDQGELVISSASSNLTIPPLDEDQIQLQEAIKVLKDNQIEIRGCFNCKYFGIAGDSGTTLGRCYDGMLGKRFSSIRDMISTYGSCPRHYVGTAEEQLNTVKEWSASLPPIK